MKKFGHILLRWYLGMAAYLVIQRCRPKIIAIAGTVNKTFTKEAIEVVLEARGKKFLSTAHTYNTDIGLPLSILGLSSGYNSYRRWLALLPHVIIKIFTRGLPEILILELGISHPGDAKKLLRIIKPDVVIITDITQRYRENFTDRSMIAKEYGYLLTAVKKTGYSILNYDTIIVRSLSSFSIRPLYFFSLQTVSVSEKNLWHVTDICTSTEGIQALVVNPYDSRLISISRFGRHHLSAFLIADIISHTLP
jgi:UDP-N-acetylmuramoyl-tripeptide--D-alanyl-D-alanine ligase